MMNIQHSFVTLHLPAEKQVTKQAIAPTLQARGTSTHRANRPKALVQEEAALLSAAAMKV